VIVKVCLIPTGVNGQVDRCLDQVELGPGLTATQSSTHTDNTHWTADKAIDGVNNADAAAGPHNCFVLLNLKTFYNSHTLPILDYCSGRHPRRQLYMP